MKRRILKYVALTIAVAILLPLAGIAEDAAITAADIDEAAVVAVEADPLSEELGEVELTLDDTPADEPEAEPEEPEEPAAEKEAEPEQSEAEPEKEEAPKAEDGEAPAGEDDAEAPAEGEEEAPVEAVAEGEPEPEAAETQETELVEESQMAAAEAAPSVPTTLLMGVKEKYVFPVGDGFTSSNTKVVLVTGNQLIAKKKGTAEITVTLGGSPLGTCLVTVKAAPKKVKLQKKLSLVVGSSQILVAKLPGGSGSQITWTSSNPAVASVDANGMVTGVGMGKAKITARTFNKKKAVCTVTVDSANAPTMVSFPMGTLFVGKGESVQLKPTLNAGAETTFTYTSKNKKFVSVTKAGGVVKGKKVNKTSKITVVTQNKKKATLKVKVLKAPTSVTLDNAAVTLNVGGTATLNASVPAKTASQVYWSSSNPGVATVSEESPFMAGTSSSVKITAVGGGTATITARTFNNMTATCTVTVNAPQKPESETEQQNPDPETEPQAESGTEIKSSFPDEKLQEKLSQYDMNKDGVLSESEVQALTELYLAKEGITTLEGIATLTSLTKLDASENSGLKADVSKNTALEKLELNQDGLTEVDVTKNTALKQLGLANNNLEKVDVSKNTALTTLDVSGNNLTQLDISNNAALVDVVKNGTPTEENGVLTYTNAEGTATLTVDAGVTIITDNSTPVETPEVKIDTKELTATEGVYVLTALPVSMGITATPDTQTYSYYLRVGEGDATALEGAEFSLTEALLTANTEVEVYAGAKPEGAEAITWSDPVKVNYKPTEPTQPTLTLTFEGLSGGSPFTLTADEQNVTFTLAPEGTVASGYEIFVSPKGDETEQSKGTVTNAAYTLNKADYEAGKTYTLKVVATLTEGTVDAQADFQWTAELNESDFEIKDGVIVAYKGQGGAIEIPATDENNNPVTAIGEGAFKENEAITSVKISKDVKGIGESAFEGCTGLESVEVPNGVETIGKAAFKNCSKLATMTTY